MQDFILHDALIRGKSALDQVVMGLELVGLLNLIRLFPQEFEPLFTYQSRENVTAAYILEMLRFPERMDEKQARTANLMKDFVNSCSPEGNWY